jgi:UDP-glucose 4-epimerase
MLRAFCHRYKLNFVGLRYMNVYGPRQDYHGAYIAVIMKMLDAIDRGESPTIMGDGSARPLTLSRWRTAVWPTSVRMKADAVDQLSTMSARANAHRSSNWPRCCCELTNCTKPINYAPNAAKPPWCATALAAPKRPARRSVSPPPSICDEGLKRLIEWRKTHIEEVSRRREEAARRG